MFLSSGHCSRCSIVCVSVPQLHEGSPVWYPHLIKFALVQPTPDLSRLSVFHVGRGALLAGGRLSDGLISTSTEGGLDFNLSIHRSMFVSALGWTMGWTWLRKDLLDFNLVDAGSDPNGGCLGYVDWRSLSALLAVSLLISDGAIPASRCRLLVLVGLRQPVMVRQALFRAGSNLLACTDLDHTRHSHSAAV